MIEVKNRNGVFEVSSKAKFDWRRIRAGKRSFRANHTAVCVKFLLASEHPTEKTTLILSREKITLHNIKDFRHRLIKWNIHCLDDKILSHRLAAKTWDLLIRTMFSYGVNPLYAFAFWIPPLLAWFYADLWIQSFLTIKHKNCKLYYAKQQKIGMPIDKLSGKEYIIYIVRHKA